MDIKRQTIYTIFLPLLFIACLISGGCPDSKKTGFDINSVKSYRDIPGVTEKEIEAIEALKSARDCFVLANPPTTEAFMLPDGSEAGFVPMFCELLSGLFDIPFTHESRVWGAMMDGLEDGTIDFTSELTPTPKRKEHYFMTLPVAQRSLSIFTHDRSDKIKTENDVNGLRLGFFEDTVTAQSILNVYPALAFEQVTVHTVPEVAEKLRDGVIDAYVDDSVTAHEFINYNFIKSKDFFPFVYMSVSLTTANPDLEPFISVMDKYIIAGGIDRLYELYKEGNHEYAKYELNKTFSDEEKAYLAGLAANGTRVPICLEDGNYPLSFYNKKAKEFQGIARDILDEISLLTGIEFDVVTDKDTPWPEILRRLRTGEISLVSELQYSEERKDYYIWTDRPYATSHYILMSRSDYPNLEIYQVVRARVGVVRDTIFDELYNRWFPDNTNAVYFDSQVAAMIALEKGEIDLFMESEHGLLTQINLREKTGFKVNISFNSPVSESFFGFHKNEELLRSIVSKTQSCINTDRIAKDWTTRVYDYEREFANRIVSYLLIFALILLLMLIVMVILFVKNRRTRRLYKNQMALLSAIFESVPDSVYSKDINGVYTSCNHTFEVFAGHSASEIIGKTVVELFNVTDAEMAGRFMEADKKVLTERNVVRVEEWVTYPDKSRRFSETVKTPMIRNNKVIGLVGITRDITERKVLIDKLSEAYARTEVMLDTIPLCCLLLNKENKCFACNSEAVRLFKVENKQEFIDRFYNLSSEYQADGRPSYEAAVFCIKKAFDEGRYIFEWMHQSLDGTPIPAIVTLVRVNYENDYAVLAYVRDMREHNQMMQEIDRQNVLLKTLNQVSAILLDPDIEKFESNLMYSMRIMAKAMDVDRVCIWKNYIRGEQQRCTLAYEWSDNPMLSKNSDTPVDISYDEDIPGIGEMLSIGKCVTGMARDMFFETQVFLSQREIISFFVMPVFVQETFWGVISFDDCHNERTFTENEELIFRSASRMLSNALIRNEMTLSIRTTAIQLETMVKEAQEANRIKSGILGTLENILNNLDSFVHVTVPDTGEILFINESMRRHYGIEDSGVGRICYKTFMQDTGKRCEDCPCIQLDKEPDKVIVWEGYNELTRRSYRHIDRYIDWIDGRTVHLLHSIDVTELITARELAEQSNRSKTTFLAKMSHEIRTPMNAIIGMAELALRDKDVDASRKHIYTIKQAGANLLAIINDILDFSKIESGKLEIVPDYYHFSSLMNDVISIIRMRAFDSQLRFVVNIDRNIPHELYGDETRVRQILINILNNAVKYTDEGFVSLTVMGKMIDEDTVNLIIDVMDSGRGIKQENIDKLFSDFVQIDSVGNKNIEGTGLGLAITWNILKAMDGDIQVFSEYGKGSTFTVTLPQKFRTYEKLVSVENPQEKSVIIYERRDIYANSIVTTVDNLGVSCDIASNEAEFQKKLQGKSYPFIFVASTLYRQSKHIISEFAPNSKIVLLTEFGDASPKEGRSILAMPAHSISVANVLNGISEMYFYKEDNEWPMYFTAPDARILVVDDIKTNLTVTEGLLLPYKMQVDLCKSGMEAINAVQSRHYDLVFMDHWMPEMDGVEAATRIRALGNKDSYYRDLPIIALTANAITGTQAMFMESGFNGFLPKPIDTVNLNSVLDKWIPKEKRKHESPHDGDGGGYVPAKKEPEAPTAVPEIDGLDAQKGIALSGGSIERYYETLAVFYDDGLEKIIQLGMCLDTGNMPLYTIHIHALKSACANIGALDLFTAARALEMAGNRADLGFIETEHPPFVSALESLLSAIQGILSARNGNEGERRAGMNDLNAILAELKTAIEEMDAGAINRSTEILLRLKLTDNTAAAVHDISRHILMAEYDEALVQIESLLQEVK